MAAQGETNATRGGTFARASRRLVDERVAGAIVQLAVLLLAGAHPTGFQWLAAVRNTQTAAARTPKVFRALPYIPCRKKAPDA